MPATSATWPPARRRCARCASSVRRPPTSRPHPLRRPPAARRRGHARGLQYYVKSEWLADLPDVVIDGQVEHHATRTTPLHQILAHQMGGAVARVPRDATAFAYRDAAYVFTVAGAWTSPEEPRDPHVAWARSTWEATRPGSMGGAYVNHLDADEGQARVRDAYGPAIYERLVDVKTAWDPENVFRLNHNIQPRR